MTIDLRPVVPSDRPEFAHLSQVADLRSCVSFPIVVAPYAIALVRAFVDPPSSRSTSSRSCYEIFALRRNRRVRSSPFRSEDQGHPAT
ncbi:MAG: hypothetical protein MZU97_10405 [Bacillus subtilis]|nr:hypothetical protein [Bacillus subtilis]